MLSTCLPPEIDLSPTPPAERTLRVLHVVNGEYYAGAERVQDLLAQHLPQFGCEVGFVCVKPDRFPTARHCCDVPLETVRVRHPWSRRAIARLANIVRDGGYDLLHSHTPRSAWAALAAGRRTGRPVIHTLHDLFLSQGGSVARRLFHRHTIGRLRHADHVTAVSPETLELAKQLRLGGARSMVRNGVPAADVALDRPAPEVWTIGTVSLLRPCKGVEVLIRAMARLRQQSQPVRATIVGRFYTRKYEREVRALVDALGVGDVIDFVGFSDDVPGHLETFDLFTLPSIGPEGLPMVLLEAMAHGLPTIGSDVPGIGDIVHDGADGRLVPPGDDRALADAVADFMGGRLDRQAMAQAARARHAAEFSATRMAEEMAQIYRRVV